MALAVERPETRLVSNSVVQLIPYGTRVLAGLILAAILTRYLGPTRYGEYGLVFAYVAVFQGIFCDWGLSTIALREIAAHPDRRGDLLRSAFFLQLLIAGSSYAVLVGSLFIAPYPPIVRLSVVIYGASLLLSAVDILTLGFTSELRMAQLVPATIAGTFVLLTLSLGAVWMDLNVVGLVGAAAAALAIQYAVATWLAFRHGYLVRGPVRREWRGLLRESWPLAIGTIFGSVIQQAPILVLGLFSLYAAGQYAAAAKVALQLTVLAVILRTSTFPLMAHSFSSDRERFRRQLERLLVFAALFGVLVGVVGVGLASLIVRGLFGVGFVGASSTFAWLVITAAILLPGIILGEAMLAAGMQKANMMILAVAVPVLFVMLAALIPSFGASGAGAAVAITYFGIVAADIVIFRTKSGLDMPLRWLTSTAVVAACVLVAFLLSRSTNEILSTAIAVAVGLILAFVMEKAAVRWMVRQVTASLLPGR